MILSLRSASCLVIRPPFIEHGTERTFDCQPVLDEVPRPGTRCGFASWDAAGRLRSPTTRRARQAMARAKGNARGGGSGRALGRVLSMTAFLPVASREPMYARLIWALLRDERTPMGRKVLLGGALGYLILPADLIPDRI